MPTQPSPDPHDVAEREGVRWAVTERGRRLQYTEEEVENALKIVVLNGGSHLKAASFLREEGIDLKATTLAKWRDRSFPRLYLRLRKELSREIGEDIAGRALERALQADNAEALYLQAAAEKVDQVDPNHLAKNAFALANAKGHNIEKAQLLRHEPTEIVETRDIGDLVGVLERLKVIEQEPKQVENLSG